MIDSGDDLLKENLNLLHAVGQGSRYDSRLIMLEHWGDLAHRGTLRDSFNIFSDIADQVVLVVGKGITFDTGGLNLKPTGCHSPSYCPNLQGSMETMHLDKSGAAATLAAATAAARFKIPRNVGLCLSSSPSSMSSSFCARSC